MARAAASRSSKVLGTALGVCAITAFTSGSIFRVAPQHGHATSNCAGCLGMRESYRRLERARQRELVGLKAASLEAMRRFMAHLKVHPSRLEESVHEDVRSSTLV